MQMRSICIVAAYADALHMDMHDLYAFFSFSPHILKKVKPDPNEIEWNLTDIHYLLSPMCYEYRLVYFA